MLTLRQFRARIQQPLDVPQIQGLQTLDLRKA
jgi:hypothetical protein